MRFLTNNFFIDLIKGRLTSADKALQKIKEEKNTKQWERGYINALEGMLLALESRNDRFVLINQIGVKEVNKFTKAFSQQSKNKMQNEFDQGFFTAWIDYIRTFKNNSRSQK